MCKHTYIHINMYQVEHIIVLDVTGAYLVAELLSAQQIKYLKLSELSTYRTKTNILNRVSTNN